MKGGSFCEDQGVNRRMPWSPAFGQAGVQEGDEDGTSVLPD